MASSLREIEEFSSPQDQFMTQQEAIDELINRGQPPIDYKYGGNYRELTDPFIGERRPILRQEQSMIVGYNSDGSANIETIPAQYGPPEFDSSYSPARRGLSKLNDVFFGDANEQAAAFSGVTSVLRAIPEYFKGQYDAGMGGGTVFNPETQQLQEFDPTSMAIGSAPAGINAIRASKDGSVVLGAMGGKIPRPKNKSDDLLYHPLGGQSANSAGKKLVMPVDRMSREVIPLNNLADTRVISPEDLYGSGLTRALGDRTEAGQMLTGLNGVRFETPVMLEGGHQFMRSHLGEGAAWASDTGKISALSGKVRSAAEMGDGTVNMVYMPMAHKGGDFSTMMTDTLLEGIRAGKITNKTKKEFDSALRLRRPEWKGINDPMAVEQLHSNGALRHAFNSTVDEKGFQAKGFPDLPSARFAITDPDLIDTPMLYGGQSIARMDSTGRILENPRIPHKSYNTQLQGNYIGGFENPVPYSVLFPDFYNARRLEGKDLGADPRSFDLANPTQSANQEWLDGVMNWIRDNPKE